MHPDIEAFHKNQKEADREICSVLASLIDQFVPEAESKI